ncbi:alpha/beta fold hydrolase [Legionella spiritensis]|uniref:Lipolytic enzyme n=1 Tax=Legionella spiritensis TaxID=452 RepID=A0A0W0Z2M8_LEGSP|nr:alpha/beta hydrolase [Legionella spiritensis]KTD63346.1 lipolytic enzyme [Legionella spiritensis]SNV35461.1 lipolytic protein [Legionella spiritensis]
MKKWIFFIGMLLCFSNYASTMPSFYGALKKATVKDATIAYYRFGHGKPLVMITGHGDTMTTWHPALLQQLSKNREVIIFDFPGVGQSTTKEAFPNRMQQFSNIVHEFIATQQLQKPDVLGFSMGGSVLLFLATQHGEMYDHFIVVGGKAGGQQTVLPEAKYFNMLSDPNLTPEQMVTTLLFPPSARKEAIRFLKTVSTIPQETMNHQAIQAQGEAVTHENKGSGIWDKLPGIKNKVMILNGMQDVLTPVKNAVMIADAIPGSWLVRIQGAGHGVLFQKPHYCAKLIELFLEY